MYTHLSPPSLLEQDQRINDEEAPPPKLLQLHSLFTHILFPISQRTPGTPSTVATLADWLCTSLPLKKARSSIGADPGSGLTEPLVFTPPPWMPPPPLLAINQVRTKVKSPPGICQTHMESATPHGKCHLPPRCGVWRWRQRTTLAFGANSLVGWFAPFLVVL